MRTRFERNCPAWRIRGLIAGTLGGRFTRRGDYRQRASEPNADVNGVCQPAMSERGCLVPAASHRMNYPPAGASKRSPRGIGFFCVRTTPNSTPKQTYVRCPDRRGNPSYVSSRRRVAEPAWSNIFASCSLCFWVGRSRATRCWYVHSSVSACHVASTLLWWQAISVTGTGDARLTRQQLSHT